MILKSERAVQGLAAIILIFIGDTYGPKGAAAKPFANSHTSDPQGSIHQQIRQLQAANGIRSLKARYFICLDTKDWTCFRATLADDVRLRIFEPGRSGPISDRVGADTIVAATRKGLEGALTIHHGHTADIEILSETTARATWPAEGLMRRQVKGVAVTRHAFNFYRETYQKINGSWRITSSDLIRQFYEWRREDPLLENSEGFAQ